MSNGCRKRRYLRAIKLAEKFERNTSMVEKTCGQDEKDFTLDVPVNLQNDRVYGKEKQYDVPERTCYGYESYGFRCNLLVRRHKTVFYE